MKDYKYKVTFLVEKVVEIEEMDCIQAELTAARKLSINDRKHVKEVKVQEIQGNVLQACNFYPVDKEWWKEHEL